MNLKKQINGFLQKHISREVKKECPEEFKILKKFNKEMSKNDNPDIEIKFLNFMDNTDRGVCLRTWFMDKRDIYLYILFFIVWLALLVSFFILKFPDETWLYIPLVFLIGSYLSLRIILKNYFFYLKKYVSLKQKENKKQG